MKLHFACLLLAVSLPAIADAFLFGVTLTNAAGVAIAAANPATTAGIIGLGTLGAALATAGVAALQPRQPTVTVIRRPASSSGRSYYRGKRQAGGNGNDLNNIFNSIFKEIEVDELGGCFERLICDATADPANFQGKAFNILAGVDVAVHLDLDPKAKAIARRIFEARHVGLAARDVQMCEDTYSQCQWTGEEMNEAVKLFKAKMADTYGSYK